MLEETRSGSSTADIKFYNNFMIQLNYFNHSDNSINSTITKKADKQSNYDPWMNISLSLFQSFLSSSFVVIMLSILEKVIVEKKSGIKELIKLSGVKQWIIWFGYFMDSLLEGLIHTLLYLICFKVGFFYEIPPLMPATDEFILFIFLTFYFMASIAFTFALSGLFDNFILAVIVSLLVLVIVCLLLPNIVLYFGFQQICYYESRGIGINWSNITIDEVNGLNLLTILSVFIADTIIYLLVAMYLDNVMPGPYGVAKPLNFFCQYVSMTNKTGVRNDGNEIITVLGILEDLPNLPIGIQTQHLRKKFAKMTALHNLSINIYQGEITVLLGHNGAGKTTLVSIITGLTSPTSGNVFVYGKNIQFHMNKIRKSLGVCMQTDLHLPKLTVIEHLIFFGMLKGFSKHKATVEANKFLINFKLARVRNRYSSQLSGGMKRKLSIGIALTGDPKLLILDEPSTGIDPESRREIWDIILSSKGQRTILITTHFMEEADALADRISIIAEGQLVCYGTPFYLKKKFGLGYRLVLICSDLDNNINEIIQLIQRVIPNATIQSSTGNGLTFLLPERDKSSFGNLFKTIESNKKNLKIIGISLTLTTLEDVFLRVHSLLTAQDTSLQFDEDLNGVLNKQLSAKSENVISYNRIFLVLWKKRVMVATRTWKTQLGKIISMILLTLLCLSVGNPFTTDQAEARASEIWTSLFCLGIIMLIGSFMFFPNNEMNRNIRQLQIMCGVSYFEYWLVCVLYDILFYYIVILFIFLTIWCYTSISPNIFQENAEKETLLLILTTFLGPMLPFVYLFSYFKRTARTFIMLITTYVLGKFLVFTLDIIIETGPSFRLTHYFKMLNGLLIFVFPHVCSYSTLKRSKMSITSVKDENVLKEEDRIWNVFYDEIFHTDEVLHSYLTRTNVDFILVWDLHKRYRGRKVVNGISFSVKSGNCFGLLGVNGAGKTTVFRMLTGDLPIAKGDARIYTGDDFLYISEDPHKFFKYVGYCPQVDALIPSFTAREMLYLIAKLRGVQTNVKKEVEIWIKALGLKQYANRRCGTYSGGNKRKLCMGMALIADPTAVFLDEPTSGVDPVSKRKMWNTVTILQTKEFKPSIILTSHSMEECEALCNKLGIMKNGEFACYGEIPVLKEKYALGFVVHIKLKVTPNEVQTGLPTTSNLSAVVTDNRNLESLISTLQNMYKDDFVITKQNERLLYFRITDNQKMWSEIFPEIEKIKNRFTIVEDYSISETSLEDIFLTIAHS
ncbi:hypothetical protein FQR65_LT08347 [Abscondita terminalis]|nr:hypothetical protein FQR65_LT08347 [Abscondita terminalis]